MSLSLADVRPRLLREMLIIAREPRQEARSAERDREGQKVARSAEGATGNVVTSESMVRRDTMRAFAEEAAWRRTTPAALAREILDAVAKADLFGEVLSKREGQQR